MVTMDLKKFFQASFIIVGLHNVFKRFWKLKGILILKLLIVKPIYVTHSSVQPDRVPARRVLQLRALRARRGGQLRGARAREPQPVREQVLPEPGGQQGQGVEPGAGRDSGDRG